MKTLALVLAIMFFLLGILYAMGTINFLASTAHAHHLKHLVVLWIFSALCLAWYRMQGTAQPSH